jgi:hypothetical protein
MCDFSPVNYSVATAVGFLERWHSHAPRVALQEDTASTLVRRGLC